MKKKKKTANCRYEESRKSREEKIEGEIESRSDRKNLTSMCMRGCVRVCVRMYGKNRTTEDSLLAS